MFMTIKEEKAKAAILYLIIQLNELKMETTAHSISKILYWADQKKLILRGEPITWDEYYRLPDGPVPTVIYDVLKPTKSSWASKHFPSLFHSLNREAYPVISALEKPNMDYLSKADVICIDASISENGKLTYGQKTDKSHDSAWLTTSHASKIDVLKIADAGKANEDQLNHIKRSISAQRWAN